MARLVNSIEAVLGRGPRWLSFLLGVSLTVLTVWLTDMPALVMLIAFVLFILMMAVLVLTAPAPPGVVPRGVIEELRHPRPPDWTGGRMDHGFDLIEKRIVWLVLGAALAGFFVMHLYAGVPAQELN